MVVTVVVKWCRCQVILSRDTGSGGDRVSEKSGEVTRLTVMVPEAVMMNAKVMKTCRPSSPTDERMSDESKKSSGTPWW